jgi:hypothetical protein
VRYCSSMMPCIASRGRALPWEESIDKGRRIRCSGGGAV